MSVVLPPAAVHRDPSTAPAETTLLPDWRVFDAACLLLQRVVDGEPLPRPSSDTASVLMSARVPAGHQLLRCLQGLLLQQCDKLWQRMISLRGTDLSSTASPSVVHGQCLLGLLCVSLEADPSQQLCTALRDKFTAVVWSLLCLDASNDLDTRQTKTVISCIGEDEYVSMLCVLDHTMFNQNASS